MTEVNESNATDDDGNVTDEGGSEDIELLEEKLNSKAFGSILARKSGPGRAWPPENNAHCGVIRCSSTTASCKDLWFFKLPVHSYDPERRVKWLEKIKRPDVQPYHRLLVCERHFDRKDIGGCKIGIITPNSKKYLKKGVIPTLHLPAENKVQKHLQQTQPKRVYKRIYQEVNNTKSYEEPSTSSSVEHNYAFKKLKTQKKNRGSTITDNTDKIKPNTLIKNVSTDEDKHGVRQCLEIEVEPNLTKIKPKENKELLLLSTLCNELANKPLETLIKLKLKFQNEPYDYSKYSDDSQLLIHEMYHANPQFYEVLQDMLSLPPISALKNFRPSSEEGLNKKCMQCLVAKLGLMSPIQKYGILCIAIVKMTPNVYYDYEWDIINGVNKQAAPYRFAIIAMVKGISADWHQIVSVNLFYDITPGTFHKYRCWADELILSLGKIGVSIIAVVTSTDDFFIQAYSTRESSVEHLSLRKYYYLQNGKSVWHIFDPLHLIWCLHEELQDNLFVFNGNCTADWKHVKEFNLIDKKRKVPLVDRSCMIPPGSSHQDKLEYAAKTLLHRTTAAGIVAFVDMKILSEEARHTAKFLMILSETFMFVYPNARVRGLSASKGRPTHNQTEPDKKSKKRLVNAKKAKTIINKKLQFFKKLKTHPKNNENKNHNAIKCLVSSFRTILDIIAETKMLEVTSPSETSELISLFNMNPLIEFIDTIKLKNTLTSELLMETINKSLIQNDQTKIKAFIEYADRLIELDGFYREEPNMSMVMKDHRSYISEYSAFSDNDGNSLMYVATYLLEKMYQQFRNVVSTRMRLLNSSVHYENRGAGFSGTIIIPDDEFLELVIKMDTAFLNFWKMAMLSGKWFTTLKEKMSKAIADVRYSGEAATLDFIEDLFIHLRLYHVLKYNKTKFEKDKEMHEFVVKRLEGYKIDYKKVQLPCLECFRNPEYT